MTNEERLYKIFKIFYYNSADQKLIKEIEQSIRSLRFIDRKSYNMMEDAKVANRVVFELKENRNKYSQVMYDYSIVLKNMYYLAKELNLENSLELSILFSYLLWYGYLSKNKEYKFSSNYKKIIPGLFFANIMDGRGVCLNNSEMLKDFLNLNDFNCVIMENSYNSSTKLNYVMNIITKSEENKQKKTEELIERICKLGKPNHAFNLIEDNNKFYIYDATNLILHNIINQYKSELINGRGIHKLFPYQSYMLCISNSEIKLLDKLMTSVEFESSPYQKSDLIAISEITLEILKYSKGLLEDFYIEIKPNIIAITKETDKIVKKRIVK